VLLIIDDPVSSFDFENKNRYSFASEKIHENGASGQLENHASSYYRMITSQ
jgi:wobble nucleotide-excising tRNase